MLTTTLTCRRMAVVTLASLAVTVELSPDRWITTRNQDAFMS